MQLDPLHVANKIQLMGIALYNIPNIIGTSHLRIRANPLVETLCFCL
jgi:hypothetical protein